MQLISTDPSSLKGGPVGLPSTMGEPGCLEEVLEGLSLQHQAVVELIVFGQLTQSEVGRLLGFSRQRAHVLWHEARCALTAAAS